MKKRQHFEKPSVMRKKKKAAARKRLLKKMRKMNALSPFRFFVLPDAETERAKGFGTLHRFDGSASVLFGGAPPQTSGAFPCLSRLSFPDQPGADDLVGDRGGYTGSPFGFPCFFNHHLPGIIMSLTTRIEQDYIAAYKAKDALRLGVLRLLKTAAKNLQRTHAAVTDRRACPPFHRSRPNSVRTPSSSSRRPIGRSRREGSR